MLETLEKMSGKTHNSYVDSKTVTTDAAKLMLNNESKLTLNMATKEEPVISYNDMAFISPRNSIVFSAGESPIWNRNQTILPMSWRLQQTTIYQPGQEDYSLKTLPTTSTARDFDVRKNQPDFEAMLSKRMKQALQVADVTESYKNAYGLSDYEMSQLDQDDLADEIMSMINVSLSGHKSDELDAETLALYGAERDDEPESVDSIDSMISNAQENTELTQEVAKKQAKREEDNTKRYAGNMLSRKELRDNPHSFDQEIIALYNANLGDFKNDKLNFIVDPNQTLRSADGSQVYIQNGSQSQGLQDAQKLNEAAKDKKTRIFAEEDIQSINSFTVQNAFYDYLASLDSWDTVAHGVIERGLKDVLTQDQS